MLDIEGLKVVAREKFCGRRRSAIPWRPYGQDSTLRAPRLPFAGAVAQRAALRLAAGGMTGRDQGEADILEALCRFPRISRRDPPSKASSYAAASNRPGTTEALVLNKPAAGVYYVRVQANAASGGVSVLAAY